MRGTRAKKLRRETLGIGYSVRDRKYATDDKGTVRCKGKRSEYQQAKRSKR